MIAAALLVVLGSATLMQLAGLSMAMGAFVAGVMLAESSYRHELEADIEPFRGILLGLFFMAVGLSLELGVVIENWATDPDRRADPDAGEGGRHLRGLPAVRLPPRDAVRIALLLPQGGEFAFVLFSAAASAADLFGRDGVAADRHRHAVDGDDAAVRPGDAGSSSCRRPKSSWRRISTAPAPTC